MVSWNINIKATLFPCLKKKEKRLFYTQFVLYTDIKMSEGKRFR